MANDPVNLSASDQKTHILLDLYAQLHAIGMALSELKDKVAAPEYDQTQVDTLTRDKAAIDARICEIKKDGAFVFPSDTDAKALGDACDALAQIDASTATAIDIINAANGVVAALPISKTKPAAGH